MKMKVTGFLKKILAIISKAKSIADLKNRMRNIKTRFMIYSLLSTDKKVLFGSISHKLQGLIQDQTEAPATAIEETTVANQESNLRLQLAPVLYNNMNATTLPLNITNIKTHDVEDTGDEVADTRVCEEVEEVVLLEDNITEVAEEAEQINEYVISACEHEENQENEEDDNEKTKDMFPDLRHSLFEEKDEYEMGRPGSVIELVKRSKEAQNGEEFKLEDQIDEVADLFIQRFHQHMRIQKQNSFKRRSNTINSANNL